MYHGKVMYYPVLGRQARKSTHIQDQYGGSALKGPAYLLIDERRSVGMLISFGEQLP
jgi:hypothetical protein